MKKQDTEKHQPHFRSRLTGKPRRRKTEKETSSGPHKLPKKVYLKQQDLITLVKTGEISKKSKTS